VDMHDQYLIDMCRRAHNAFEEQHRQFRRKAKEGLETVLAAVDILLLLLGMVTGEGRSYQYLNSREAAYLRKEF
jgi:hypothetical protein